MSTNSSLVSGCAGYWPCTEASGTRVDSTAANNLTQTGSILTSTFNPAFNVATNPDKTALYDGNNANFLALADNTRLRMGNTNYTVCCWVNLSTVVSTHWVSKGANETNGFEFALGYASGFGVFFNTYPTGAASPLISAVIPRTDPLQANKWYFAVGQKAINGPTRCKINNEDWAVSPTTGSGFASSVAMFAIGTRVTSAVVANVTPVTGQICNVGIWSRLLKDAECGDLYAAGLGLDYPFGYPV